MTSTRKFGQDKLAAAINTLNWTVKHIKDFLELGYVDKPDIAKQCVLITSALLDLQESIERLKKIL